ncbi:MAG: hypothetical protein IRZ04_00625, partial [Rhodospirillales bacterium]|nr:hypothetical protein [Rhodospirillales bacterium]
MILIKVVSLPARPFVRRLNPARLTLKMKKLFQGVAIGLLAGMMAAPSLADEGKSAGDIMVRGRAIAVVPQTGGDVSVIGGDPEATTEIVP